MLDTGLLSWLQPRKNILYQQNGMLVFRLIARRSTCYNSGNQTFCFLKCRLLTCPNFFLRNFFYFVFKDREHFLLLDPILLFVTWGVTNREVLLLATIRYVHTVIVYAFNNVLITDCTLLLNKPFQNFCLISLRLKIERI